MYSPAVNYTGDSKIGIFRIYFSASILLPLQGRQDGNTIYNPDYYKRLIGSDLFVGLAKDYPVIDRFGLIPALGWHLNGLRLRGNAQIYDFYSLTTGFGLKLLTRHQGNQDLLNYGYFSISFDYIDFLYANNKLKRGHSITFGIGHTF